jgi:hypothetical protein
MEPIFRTERRSFGEQSLDVLLSLGCTELGAEFADIRGWISAANAADVLA